MRSHVPVDAASSDMIRFLDRIDAEGRRARDAWGADWDRDVEAWRGRGSGTRARDDARRGRRFEADIITAAMARRVSLLGESKPTFDVVPVRPHLDATADIFKVAVQSVMDSAQFPAANGLMLTLAAIMGAAGMRTRWRRDPHGGLGEIVLDAVDPRFVWIDPAVNYAHQINAGQYVVIETVQPTGALRARYPEAADKIKADTGLRSEFDRDRANAGGSTNILRRLFQRGPESDDAVPRTRQREYFLFDPATDDDGAPRYPGGRYLLRAGDDLILNPDDDRNPYFDGLCDLDLFDNALDPDHPWGRSEIEALRTLGRAFNDSGDLLVKSYQRNGMPWIIADRSALDADVVQRLRDEGQYVIEHAPGRTVNRTPGVGQDGALSLMEMLLQLVSNQTGITDPSMQGRGRLELRSGAQVEGLENAAQVLIRASARRLEMTLERVGQKIISRILQFYDDDRILTYYGGGETYLRYVFERQRLVAEIIAYGIERAVKNAAAEKREPTTDQLADAMLLAVKQAWRDFRFRVVPYSSLSNVKIQRAMLKLQLAQSGLIRVSTALREIGIDNPDEEWREAAREAALRQQLGFSPAPPKGKKK